MTSIRTGNRRASSQTVNSRSSATSCWGHLCHGTGPWTIVAMVSSDGHRRGINRETTSYTHTYIYIYHIYSKLLFFLYSLVDSQFQQVRWSAQSCCSSAKPGTSLLTRRLCGAASPGQGLVLWWFGAER